MTDCVHPYDSVKTLRIDAVLDNRPRNRVTTEFCTDCGHFLSSEDSIGRTPDSEPTIRIGKDNSSCDHPHDSVSNRTFIIRTVHDTVMMEYECKYCEECGHAIERHEIDLNDRDALN